VGGGGLVLVRGRDLGAGVADGPGFDADGVGAATGAGAG
jgi:hypothetical protein